MTARLTTRVEGFPAQGDSIAADKSLTRTPGTLWERVAERETSHESIPQRVERIMRDHDASPRAALRVALAESRLERAKAAHPAGKGRTMKDDFWHLDGEHRTSAPDANGRNVARFEFGIRGHLESCVKVPRETINTVDDHEEIQ